MKANLALRIGVIAATATIISPATNAFDYPFSSETIRAAYSLAEAPSDRRADFLKPYQQNLPMPNTGPWVRSVRIQTPFTYLVDQIAAEGPNYHVDDAERDFFAKREPFRIQIEIAFTPTYPKANDTAATLGDFWNDFKVRVAQKNDVQPLKTVGKPSFADPYDGTVSGYTGAEIDLDFDAKKLGDGDVTTVEVDTPDGQNVEVTFDLSSLQ
jgi:hypothetical protein